MNQQGVFKGKGNFFDNKLPAGFTPFNVRDLGNSTYSKLYVTYRGSRMGSVGRSPFFSNCGFFEGTGQPLDTDKSGYLQGPYGLDQAPANFGEFSNDILVGNFASGLIDAYNPGWDIQGTSLTIEDGFGNPGLLPIQGLMALHFGKRHLRIPVSRRSPCSSPHLSSMGFLGLYGTITPAT